MRPFFFLKNVLSLVALGLSLGVWAVPAYPGWQTKTQADGSTIEVRLIGDEFYSFWETRDGQLAYELKDGGRLGITTKHS